MAIEIVAKPDALAVVAEIGVGQSAVRRVAVALIGITAVNAVVKVADAAQAAADSSQPAVAEL